MTVFRALAEIAVFPFFINGHSLKFLLWYVYSLDQLSVYALVWLHSLTREESQLENASMSKL
jgi:hypothetical protein